jgi:hypothetical protein
MEAVHTPRVLALRKQSAARLPLVAAGEGERMACGRLAAFGLAALFLSLSAASAVAETH